MKADMIMITTEEYDNLIAESELYRLLKNAGALDWNPQLTREGMIAALDAPEIERCEPSQGIMEGLEPLGEYLEIDYVCKILGYTKRELLKFYKANIIYGAFKNRDKKWIIDKVHLQDYIEFRKDPFMFHKKKLDEISESAPYLDADPKVREMIRFEVTQHRYPIKSKIARALRGEYTK